MPVEKATAEKQESPASAFGEILGKAFEEAVLILVRDHLAEKHAEYTLLQPEEGKHIITLQMPGGLARQMDNVIVARASDDPVALLETKWLKDARHHNDKGAWILQLREVRKKYATIRGAVAVLAGYWTEGVGVWLMSEGRVKMVLVATDEQVYSTLQAPLDEFLGADSFILDPQKMRKRYIRPDDLHRFILHLHETGKLQELALRWLDFEQIKDGQKVVGRQLVKAAIDDLLDPLPENPSVEKLEIALQISTGNTIYREFADLEEAQQFIQTYFHNPQAILDQISSRKRQAGS